MFARLQKLREERESGFTLIELLVVILIIGILAAIAIPAFLNQRKSAVDSSVQSDVSNAAKQIETLAVKASSTEPISATAGTDAYTLQIGTSDTISTKVSDGTELTVTGSINDGYTITGTNDGGDVAATDGYVYKSLEGGFVQASSTGGAESGKTVSESYTFNNAAEDMDTMATVQVTGKTTIYTDGSYIVTGTVTGAENNGTVTKVVGSNISHTPATVTNGTIDGSGTIAGYDPASPITSGSNPAAQFNSSTGLTYWGIG